MNKQEKLIVAVLFLALLGTMFVQHKEQQRRAEYLRANATNETVVAEARGISPDAASALTAGTNGPAVDVEAPAAEPVSAVPETTAALTNGLCRIVLTSKGGAVKSAELLAYPRTLRAAPEESVVLDFSERPALSLEGLPGFGRHADFEVDVAEDGHSAVLRARRSDGLCLDRTLAFTNGYRLAVVDRFSNVSTAKVEVGTSRIVIGAMRADVDADDTSLAADARVNAGRKPQYPELSKAKGLAKLFGASGGGCSAARLPEGAPLSADTTVTNAAAWAAVRTRFFVQVLTPEQPASDVLVRARRAAGAAGAFRLEEVDAAMGGAPFTLEPTASLERTYDYYAGPRKMASLRALGDGQVHLMRFGMWRVFCEWLLDLLNILHRIVPNYGVAIILLTCLVRLALLPVTKRSAESMRRMQAMQPKLKEVQALYKDDPQKLQRETMRLYGEHKVNPLSSCLPMLIQLPVFVALFTVLRSAVELRFEPFLWVMDLSGPENLFKESLGFGINILPVLMSGTMALQSFLTPQAGDASQQRMMMIMMPIMMLVMFYSFPAGLGLYWTTSQVLAIFGLLWQRRKNKAAAARTADGVEIISPPRETRQMRRARDR
jgi:YidC/Oxa1 family membrane protein insertase